MVAWMAGTGSPCSNGGLATVIAPLLRRPICNSYAELMLPTVATKTCVTWAGSFFEFPCPTECPTVVQHPFESRTAVQTSFAIPGRYETVIWYAPGFENMMLFALAVIPSAIGIAFGLLKFQVIPVHVPSSSAGKAWPRASSCAKGEETRVMVAWKAGKLSPAMLCGCVT